MRPLTPTLEAHQQSSYRLPHVEATVRDYHQGIRRLAWERIYTGTEPDSHHGIAFDDAGNMHRIRVVGTDLYRQRITSPDDTSDYSSWSYLSAGCAGPCAIAALDARVWILWRTTGNVIAYRYSNNRGLTWSTPATMASYANVLAMTATFWGAGPNLVVFTLRSDELSAIVWDSDTDSLVVHRIVTFAPPHHPHTITQTFGLGATWRHNVCQVVFAGLEQDTPYNHYNVYRCTLGPTHFFSSIQHFVRAPEGAQVTYEYPDCHYPYLSPEDYEETQITLVERFSGTDPYDRPMICNVVRDTLFVDTAFTEPRPFVDAQPAFGFRMATDADHWWLSMPSGIWWTPRPPPPPVDLTPHIMSIHHRTHAVASAELASGPGTLVIELDNSEGQWANPGTGGLAALQLRSELELRLGYRTTDPVHSPESVPAGTFWIDSWHYHSAPNRSLFTLYCLDGWSLANRWTPRHQMTWNTATATPTEVWTILFQVLARIGIRLRDGLWPRSPAILNFQPEFSLVPGQRGDTAIRRLLAMVPDMLVFRGQDAFVKNPLPAEASCYDYGPDDHPIAAGRYAGAVTTSRTRAIGRHTVGGVEEPVIGDAFDWDLLQLFDYLVVTYDANLDDPAVAEQRAESMLRSLALEARPATITVPTNVGQELLDVVEITDPRCGIVSDRRRVQNIATVYDRLKLRYDQTMTLGAP